MIETLLRALGLRTGRFTSPHVERMTERISLDGEPLSDERFVARSTTSRRTSTSSTPSRTHPLSFFETVVAWRTPPSPTPPSTSRSSRSAWAARGTPPTSPTPRSRSSLPIAVDHARYLGDDARRDRRREGRHHQGRRRRGARRAAPDVAEVLLRAAAEVGATLVREGLDFGVVTPGAGGRRPGCLAAGPRGELRRRVPAALRRAPGAERRGRAGGGRGLHRRRQRSRSTTSWSRRRSPR